TNRALCSIRVISSQGIELFLQNSMLPHQETVTHVAGLSVTHVPGLYPPGPPTDMTPEHVAISMENVRRLHEAGVPILAGTDQATHGISIHRDLELLVQAGLEPIDALEGATSAAAKAFGLTDRGRIAKGLRADLVLVQGDPTVNIKATRAIQRVWKTGVEIDRMIPAAHHGH
ncbi:MAG TPA: amidohydrolase family protein, partial [Thermoanaerobaculia bacterium]|nr:amidohydrolase family protein [Thermoanaerobaculia bacterium]